MAADLRWDDVQNIAIELADKYREVAPLEVRFTDLHRYITSLPGICRRPQRFERSQT